MTPNHDELDRIIERYQAKMPGWMARFVTWIRKPELRIARIISGVLLVLYLANGARYRRGAHPTQRRAMT